jgi:hypothetical protein
MINMTKMYVRHTVSDFAKWKSVFDNHDVTRRKFGAKKSEAFSNSQNPNEVLAVIEWENKEQANRFLKESDVQEIMHNGGVTNAPEVSYAE